METVSRSKKCILGEEDHISRLPEAVLGDIVILLPTRDGGRTQVLSSRWRLLWRSAPLNIDIHERPLIRRIISAGEISSILSSHLGPDRRFCIPTRYLEDDGDPTATLDGWLRSPALDGLQELEFHYGSLRHSSGMPPLPPSARRLWPTLCVASFGACSFLDGDALHLPLLEQLSLMNVGISETSLHAFLAGCPSLQSLMLVESIDSCSCIRIVSRTLRSIGVRTFWREDSRLPDAILGDIVSLLPTRDGGRTRILSSRWRHIWRSAPLNVDTRGRPPLWRVIPAGEISGILSSHLDPGRRFCIPMCSLVENGADPTATLDGCRMPAVPPSARRFWPTLRVASFGACAFPDGDAGGAPLNLPLLEQLSLMNVGISESSLHSMLAGCPALKSLVVTESIGSCSRIRIASRTLRSVAVQNSWGEIRFMLITQGSCVVNSTMVVPSVKVLALTHVELSLDVVIDFMKCFPCLENLYIQIKKTLQLQPAKSSGREESSGSSRRPSPLPFPKPSPAAAHPPSRGAMETISRGKKSNHGEDDRISRLPDAILEDIISLLPTKDGGRTQVLSSRWRPLWRSAPLNVDIHDWYLIPKQRLIRAGEISGILSSHLGPAGRRFSIPTAYLEENKSDPAATLDGWLRSPALDGLQELEFHYGFWSVHRKPPLPPSARRFSPTLRVASFGACSFQGSALQMPLLEQLSLKNVGISESSLHAMLAGCPALKSLMLTQSVGSCSRIRIVSRTLRSIGVHLQSFWGQIRLQQLIIEDAPCLERLLLFGEGFGEQMVILVVSAPKLKIFGQLPVQYPRLEFGATIFQGSSVVNSTMVMPSVKVLALTHANLSLDVVIDFMKCFPCLENLYIKINKEDSNNNNQQSTKPRVSNAWRRKYHNLIGTLDIRLKKIVVATYRANKAHVNFASFFVLNARVLQSMVLDVDASHNNDKAWIERQHQLLQVENRASKAAKLDFMILVGLPMTLILPDQVHDLSTADPFVGFGKPVGYSGTQVVPNWDKFCRRKQQQRERKQLPPKTFPLPLPKPSPAAALPVGPPWRRSPEARRVTLEKTIASAASLTPSSKTSPPSSPPRTAAARRPSPPGGVLSGAPPLSTSTSTNTPPFRRLIPAREISGILSSHLGPGRRFCIPASYLEHDANRAATLDGWLRSPALDGLQELEFDLGIRVLYTSTRIPPLPPSARRFSPTLRVASFGACDFPVGGALQMPVLEQLSLKNVGISESSLHSMLAGCPALRSLMVNESIGSCSRIRNVSRTLRSIGVQNSWGNIRLQQLIIEDAPCLERLLLFGESFGRKMVISVVSAQKSEIFGQLPVQCYPRLKFGATVFQLASRVGAGEARVPQILLNEKVLGGLLVLTSLRNSGEFERRVGELAMQWWPESTPWVPVYGFNDGEAGGEHVKDAMVSIVRMLRHRLPIQNGFVKVKLVKNCFSDADMVDAVANHRRRDQNQQRSRRRAQA
nr:unnamed protein product [Digitaria exilis]